MLDNLLSPSLSVSPLSFLCPFSFLRALSSSVVSWLPGYLSGSARMTALQRPHYFSPLSSSKLASSTFYLSVLFSFLGWIPYTAVIWGLTVISLQVSRVLHLKHALQCLHARVGVVEGGAPPYPPPAPWSSSPQLLSAGHWLLSAAFPSRGYRGSLAQICALPTLSDQWPRSTKASLPCRVLGQLWKALLVAELPAGLVDVCAADASWFNFSLLPGLPSFPQGFCWWALYLIILLRGNLWLKTGDSRSGPGGGLWNDILEWDHSLGAGKADPVTCSR